MSFAWHARSLIPPHSCPVSPFSSPPADCKIWLWCQPSRSSFGCSQISTDDCRQIDEKRHIEKGKAFKILWKRDVPSFAFVTVFNIFFFHSHFPIIPWYHAQYVQQRLNHKHYFNNSGYHCQHQYWINALWQHFWVSKSLEWSPVFKRPKIQKKIQEIQKPN